MAYAPTGFEQELTETKEGKRLYQQEKAILEITELICEIMERDNVQRSKLAGEMDKTRGYITQLLNGTANMTIRTMADLFTALGYEFRASCVPLDSKESRAVGPRVVWTVDPEELGEWDAKTIVSSEPPSVSLEK